MPSAFGEGVREALDFHNFVLEQYFEAPPVDASKVIDDTLALADRLKPLITDVSYRLNAVMASGHRLLFEGAQGTLLDVDHGTYPYVTSSNTVAGAAAAGAGVAPQRLDYVLGITKAYSTRVGSGPFPTELVDATGEHLRNRGQEFGSVTGRPRRCGWFDAAGLRRAVQLNGTTGLCITKLDVLDGLPSVRLGVGYRFDGREVDILPYGADAVGRCEPVYEDFAGWSESTFGMRDWDELPANARRYLERLAEVLGVPIDLVSTGAGSRADDRAAPSVPPLRRTRPREGSLRRLGRVSPTDRAAGPGDTRVGMALRFAAVPRARWAACRRRHFAHLRHAARDSCREFVPRGRGSRAGRARYRRVHHDDTGRTARCGCCWSTTWSIRASR